MSRGLSREELAALAGVTSKTIYALEVGNSTPNKATVRVLCHALECEPAEIGLAA